MSCHVHLGPGHGGGGGVAGDLVQQGAHTPPGAWPTVLLGAAPAECVPTLQGEPPAPAPAPAPAGAHIVLHPAPGGPHQLQRAAVQLPRHWQPWAKIRVIRQLIINININKVSSMLVTSVIFGLLSIRLIIFNSSLICFFCFIVYYYLIHLYLDNSFIINKYQCYSCHLQNLGISPRNLSSHPWRAEVLTCLTCGGGPCSHTSSDTSGHNIVSQS